MTAVVLEQLPDEVNLDYVAGDGFGFTLTFTDDDDEALDLTGYTFTSTIRDVAPTIDTADAETGIIGVSLTAAQTAAGLGSAWRFRWTPPGGQVRTILAGFASARPL